jgi:hypothetical protein
MPSFRISDLPPHMLAMIRPADRAALGLLPASKGKGADKAGNWQNEAKAGQQSASGAIVTHCKSAKRPNKTEAHYLRDRLAGRAARYEAVTFRLAAGHRYTPDFVVMGQHGDIAECHEVKGSYRLHSQDGARMRFDQARREWPGIRWVWATWTGKGWKIEDSWEGVT